MTPLAMTFDERYRAISGRDKRFDGQFITAVHSTGIYCRPSCPARTPQPQNVSFYLTSAAAHEAGFRACKRCLPDAAPGSPAWDLDGDVAARAMRLIADGLVDREGVGALAAQLGYSQRHLTRVLTAKLGAGPLALARAHRAHTARMLLTGTGLPAADVAFAAGFSSVRQFNDTVREVFDQTPSQLRARGNAEAHEAPSELTLRLPYREPYDFAGILAWMAARAIEGVEPTTASSYARFLRMPGGPVWFEVSADAPGRLRLRVRLSTLTDLSPLIARVRRLFDLDADPEAIDAALSADPALAGRIAALPGIRVPGASDSHEMLIRAMVGQQISVQAATLALGRLTAALGEPVEGGMLFPTMQAIAERGREALYGPAARTNAIMGAARALADGTLTLGPGDDRVEQRERLLAMPGIGPWTADYVRMRTIGDPDVTLPGDSAVRLGARTLGIPDKQPDFGAWAAALAPWRSYATAHLWRALSKGTP